MKILDYGSVELIESWGSDERIIEAARMSTGKGFLGWGSVCDCDWAECGLPLGSHVAGCSIKPGDEKLLAYLYNNKHMTPFEMAGMVIEVKAPIFVFREWHRHRTQSYNEMSARYIPLPNENYTPAVGNVVDRMVKALITANKQQQTLPGGEPVEVSDIDDWLEDLREVYIHAQDVYDRGIKLGIPKELARLPVPVARYSRMRASANLRNWLAFLTLRMDPAAQWEIRQYANAVGQLIAKEFPRTWGLFQTKIALAA